MTTSEPQAGRRDDGGEHRTIGQRIRDAVLGDPEETRDDDPGVRGPDRGGPDQRRPEQGYTDQRHTEQGQPEQGYTDQRFAEQGHPADARGGGHATPGAGPTGPGTADDGWAAATAGAGQGVGSTAGHPEPQRADAGPDREHASYAPPTHGYVQDGAVPDPVRDDVRQDTTPRDVGAAPADRDLVTSSYDPDRDTGYDPQAAGTAMSGPSGDTRDHDPRDLVTSSYDPDRDTGYDPQAAGTAMSGPTGDTRDQDPREYNTHDYDPTRDTGYVGEGRGDADRATGHRDADYDTGRVDAGRVDTRFSDVDDTSTVEPTGTGRATPDTRPDPHASGDAGSERRAEAVADETTGSGGRERLLSSDRARDYTARWDALKGDFVDEPRRAVAQADGLVGELLDEIQRVFADQRRDLEQGLDHDQASTEDLRLALRRYRSFFDRLLSF